MCAKGNAKKRLENTLNYIPQSDFQQRWLTTIKKNKNKKQQTLKNQINLDTNLQNYYIIDSKAQCSTMKQGNMTHSKGAVGGV